jgi:hypothetical protein
VSNQAIGVALLERLAAMTPALPTEYENKTFDPVAGEPYQKEHLLMAAPDNAMFGSYHRERGIYQVTLCYPLDSGAGEASEQADAVQAWFKRGTTLPLDGNNILTVHRTPAIGSGFKDKDRWCVPVSIPFFAEIFN